MPLAILVHGDTVGVGAEGRYNGFRCRVAGLVADRAVLQREKTSTAGLICLDLVQNIVGNDHSVVHVDHGLTLSEIEREVKD